jgi:transcriptional antiterminator NusG
VSQDSINAEDQPLDASAESQPLESSAEGVKEDAVTTDAVIADDLVSGNGSDLEAGSELDDDDDASDLPDEFDGDEAENVKPIEEADDNEVADDVDKQWYILKVQSNREKSICDGLIRRVKVEGLDSYFGEIIVPTEDVAEFKNGKRRVVKRKLYPGYIVVNMVLNEETWFLVRETPGIGDFTGSAGKPTPMLSEEIERIVKAAHPEEDDSEQIKTAIPFKLGDRVRIKDGTFENFEGDVEGIDEANGRVTVMINIFGRSTPVELEHWQIEQV